MSENNPKEINGDSSFEEIAKDFEKWLSEEKADHNPKKTNARLKIFLSLILTRYIDTKEHLNYLKEYTTDNESIKHLEEIDKNLNATNLLYELVLQQLIDTRKKDIERISNTIEKLERANTQPKNKKK